MGTLTRYFLSAGIILSAVFMFPQQAMACHWWDAPCIAEEAWREIEAGVEQAKRVADEALNVAAQRLAEETEELAKEAASVTVEEARFLASQATNAYTKTANLAKEGYQAARSGIEKALAAIERALMERLMKTVLSSNRGFINEVQTAGRNLDADGIAMVKRIEKSLLSNNITKQTISDFQGLFLKLGLIDFSQKPRSASVASAVRRSAIGPGEGRAPLSRRQFIDERLPHLRSQQARRQAGVLRPTGSAIHSAAAGEGEGEGEKSIGLGKWKSVGIVIEGALVKIGGASFSIGLMGDVNHGMAITLSVNALLGEAKSVGPKIVLAKETVEEMSGGSVSLGLGPLGADWGISLGMRGWEHAIPTVSFALPTSAAPFEFDEVEFTIGGGYIHAFVIRAEDVPDLFSPPSAEEVKLAAKPECDMPPGGFLINTNSQINGEIYRLTTGWAVGDDGDASLQRTGVYLRRAEDRTLWPSIWTAYPADRDNCSFYLFNSWLHGHLTVVGDSVYHTNEKSTTAQWKFYSNSKGTIGGYRIVSAADGREFHTGYNGSNFDHPRMEPFGAGGPRDAIWMLNRTFNNP